MGCFLLKLCCVTVRLFRADTLAVFLHIHFHRLVGLSSVDLITFLGDGVKSHGVSIARLPFTGQHISTFSVMSMGLIFFIRPTVFKLN